MDSLNILNLMDSQELYKDFEKTFMDSNNKNHEDHEDQDLIYNSLHKNLNFKKQMLESFRDYLEVVIKSIDDGEYNEKMIDELCDIIDGYYKNDNDDENISQNIKSNENRLALFSKPQIVKDEDYETDSQSSKTSNTSTKANKIKNNNTDNDTSDSDDEDAVARFLDSDDDTPPIDVKKIMEKAVKERLEREKKEQEEKEKKEQEEKEQEEQDKKDQIKQKVDRFYESFINKNIDINKRVFKANTESLSYLNKFTKNSFVY
jgi:hypothetical protein